MDPSRGSAELPAVVRLVTCHAPMLGRTLLYTAMIRARRLLVIVGQKKALYLAVPNSRRSHPSHVARRAAGWDAAGRVGAGGCKS